MTMNMNFEMGDEHPEEFDPNINFHSVEGLESVAESLEEKYPYKTTDDKNWYGDYGNIIGLASYLIYERYEMTDSKDLLYFFEKPHKWYNEFIEMSVWHDITHGDHYFSEEEFEHIGDVFEDFISKRRTEK